MVDSTKLIETISTLQMIKATYEKKSTPKKPFKAMISAISCAIECVEKQIPIKPLYKKGTSYKWIDTVRERGRCVNVEKYSNRDACPRCSKNVLRENYCKNCGQRLDWSE